jgi:hypothetical protein
MSESIPLDPDRDEGALDGGDDDGAAEDDHADSEDDDA